MTTFSGNYQATDGKIGIVVARFNNFVTERLLAGAQDSLERHGLTSNQIDIAWVPGAFEIPLALQNLAQTKQYAGLIALGAVIRGETSHYDYVCNEVAKGVAQVGLQQNLPTMFGVLTTDTVEQAVNRAGVKGGNKGADCAESVLEMIDLQHQINLK